MITLGIYGLWVPFKVRSWYCGHLYMTGYRRRHSVSKTPVWRDVLIFLTALLCFALLLTGIIVIATGNAPWQKSQPGTVQPPPSHHHPCAYYACAYYACAHYPRAHHHAPVHHPHAHSA